MRTTILMILALVMCYQGHRSAKGSSSPKWHRPPIWMLHAQQSSRRRQMTEEMAQMMSLEIKFRRWL